MLRFRKLLSYAQGVKEPEVDAGSVTHDILLCQRETSNILTKKSFTCREVQRILMELLTQMDGFDQTVNVKVIMATNRADTLDPALLRPGRLDRKIECPLPDRRQKRLVFQVRIPSRCLWRAQHLTLP